MRWALLGIALAGGLATALGAAAVSGVLPWSSRPAAVRVEAVGSVPAAHRPASPSVRPERAPAPVSPPPPGARLAIPALGLDAPLDTVTDRDRVLEVPLDPRRVGWWSGSVAPGSERGTAVIDGHINYAGTNGAFSVLPAGRPGQLIRLSEGSQVRSFVIRAVRSYPKTGGLPADLTDRSGAPRLVLVTCGGAYEADAHSYADNIVVYAVPA